MNLLSHIAVVGLVFLVNVVMNIICLSACLPLPSLFVHYAHLTVMISVPRARTYTWLRHGPSQSLALRFGTNSLLRHNQLYQLVSQVPLFVLSRLLSSLWVCRTGSAFDWCALQEAFLEIGSPTFGHLVFRNWKSDIRP